MTYCHHCGNDTTYPVGLSAQAMHAVKLGRKGRTNHPLDPADLCRCINAHGPATPEYMRGVSPSWDTLVDHWDELVTLLEQEQAEGTGRARKTYRRMKELLSAAQKVASTQ
ncbi:MAG TPA: hypothetical protein VFC72_02785 [Corynebacterium sp.]|nr:hypothetical protein [Corynebacterium sp.]